MSGPTESADLLARDARTTPRWAQPLVLLFLAAVSGNFVYSFVRYGDDMPLWSALGSWHMFTFPSSKHARLDAEALIGDQWVPFDLLELFPTQWDSGPRYARGAFIDSDARIRTLADSACDRHPDHPTRVRLTEVTWKVTLGSYEQPRRKEKRNERIDWPCAQTAPRPGGTLW